MDLLSDLDGDRSRPMIDREYLEDRLAILEELLACVEQWQQEHDELEVYRILYHAQDEGFIEIDEEGHCWPVGEAELCPSFQ